MKTQLEGDLLQYIQEIDSQKEINKELEEKMNQQTAFINELQQQIEEEKEESKKQQGILQQKEEEVQTLEANLVKTQKQLEEYIQQLASQKEMVTALTLQQTSSESQQISSSIDSTITPSLSVETPPVESQSIDPSSSSSIEIPVSFKTSPQPNTDSLLSRIFLHQYIHKIDVESESDRLLIDVANSVNENSM